MRSTDTRVVVFIDYQNVYHGARDVFGPQPPNNPPPTFGNVYPLKLGQMLCDRGLTADPQRVLTGVRVYRGKPVTGRSSDKVCQAFARQTVQWSRTPGVDVFTRPLKYHRATGRNGTRYWAGQEKGVDVKMALDISIGAHRNDYDTAVVVTADTDFLPALEEAANAGKRVETATWWVSKSHRGPLRVPNQKIWNHNLDESCFDLVRDDTDYLAAP